MTAERRNELDAQIRMYAERHWGISDPEMLDRIAELVKEKHGLKPEEAR